MMTDEDYKKAAAIARKVPAACWPDVVDAFVRLFEADNPRFDTVRFVKAAAPSLDKEEP